MIYWLLANINRKVNRIMVSQVEGQARLEALAGKVDKVFGEVTNLVELVAELRGELEAAGALSEGVTAALEALEAKVQAVDDLNPDTP